MELSLTGTAVRTGAQRKRVVVALVAPQEFFLLSRAGVEVLGIVGSGANVIVRPGRSTTRAMRRPGWRSRGRELNDLTVGVYEARRLALERLRAEAHRLGASGVIGIDASAGLGEHETGIRRFQTTVFLLATAIRTPRSRAESASPKVTIPLGGGP